MQTTGVDHFGFQPVIKKLMSEYKTLLFKKLRQLSVVSNTHNLSSSVCIISRGIRTENSGGGIAKWITRRTKKDSTESIVAAIPQAPFDINDDRLARIRKRKRPEIIPTRGDKNLLYNNQFEKLANAVTPLHSLKYTDQLKLKFKQIKEILREYSAKLKLAKSPFKKNGAGLPCSLKDMIPSPVIDHYRNKDEFRIKRGQDGNIKTVGFLVGNMSEGKAVCINPTNLINIKPSHSKIALSFQNYIRKSPLPVCDLFHDGGHWRGITVRSNLQGDLMGIVVMHPQQMSEEDLGREKKLLTDYFKNGDGADCNFKSLFFQACRHSRCTSESASFHLLFGEQHLYEEILGLKLRISPDAFFQVNTLGAACLYKAIQEISEIDDNTVVLDVYSGIGTIGLLLASQARSVFGVELIKQAVEDATFNAQLNNITNAFFHNGKAEKIIPEIVPEFDSMHKVVAVVNPGRSGLHPAVVKALRSCEQIKKIIYIACNPRGELTTANIINFGMPKGGKWRGQPLVPKLAVPMDMFPHTEHCELVIVLERCKA
uniref:tRNA (uracil(54)-C(5))-methyltransferase n=1 Tax=Strigamia maritima TaxID=126957 RepID=T1J7Y5_STRMM